MSRRGTGFLKAALSALHYTGTGRLLEPLTRGVGVIFMLHRVRVHAEAASGPNRILEVTPEFLEDTICLVRELGFDVVSLDELHARMASGDFDRPFAAFTFDDGYRDNLEVAYPIFKRHGLPFAVYVPTDYPDGTGDLWWLRLEAAIGAVDSLSVEVDGVVRSFATGRQSQKDAAFAQIYWWLRSLPETEARGVVDDICRRQGIDLGGLCRDLMMTWDEVRQLASDPLVTIGAHTCRHMALAKLPRSEARHEMVESVQRLERELGRPVRHFSYPYGDETSAGPREFELAGELGLATAVTTGKGLVSARHGRSLTSLPRVSLNGDYQSMHYVKVLLTGAPFALWDAARGLSPQALAARVGAAFGRRPAVHTSS